MYAPVQMQKAKEGQAPFFVELYILELRTGISYIAACDEDIVYNGDTYIAIPFSREEITRSADNLFDQTTVSLGDIDDTKLAYILSGFDFRGCKIAIFKILYPDSLNDPSIVLPVFVGHLDSPSYANGVFSCVLKSLFPTVNVPRREYQLQCNSDYGDENCGKPHEQWEATITGVNGNVITIDRDFGGIGEIIATASVLGETRNITRVDGNRVTLGINFLQDDLIGKKVVMMLSCDKTKECCARLGNLEHFSGFPAVPFESVYR